MTSQARVAIGDGKCRLIFILWAPDGEYNNQTASFAEGIISQDGIFFQTFFLNLFIIPETAILSTKYLQEAAYDPERRSRKYIFSLRP